MKNRDWNPFLMNRRLVLRGAGGLMLGLPLLEAFMSSKASAQAATRSPFVIIVVGDNGVVQAGATLGGSGEPERFWPTATGTLTKDKMLADKADAVHRRARRLRGQASHRPRHEPPLQLDGLLAFGGGCADPHRREDHGGKHQLPRPMGISVDTAIADGKEPARARPARAPRGHVLARRHRLRHSRVRLVHHARNSRACTSTRPTRRTKQIIGAVGNGTTVHLGGGPGRDAAGRAQQEHQRHPPSANPDPAGAVGSQHERSRPARSAPDRDS